jgi:hypothetical protein
MVSCVALFMLFFKHDVVFHACACCILISCVDWIQCNFIFCSTSSFLVFIVDVHIDFGNKFDRA